MWVSIEDELPQMMVSDLLEKGYRTVKVKDINDNEFFSDFGDHHCWYYDVKPYNITHWWKDNPDEETATPLHKS